MTAAPETASSRRLPTGPAIEGVEDHGQQKHVQEAKQELDLPCRGLMQIHSSQGVHLPPQNPSRDPMKLQHLEGHLADLMSISTEQRDRGDQQKGELSMR